MVREPTEEEAERCAKAAFEKLRGVNTSYGLSWDAIGNNTLGWLVMARHAIAVASGLSTGTDGHSDSELRAAQEEWERILRETGDALHAVGRHRVIPTHCSIPTHGLLSVDKSGPYCPVCDGPKGFSHAGGEPMERKRKRKRR